MLRNLQIPKALTSSAQHVVCSMPDTYRIRCNDSFCPQAFSYLTRGAGRDCLLFFHIAEAGQNQGVSWGVASASASPPSVLCLAVSNSCCCCHCSSCCSCWLCWRFKYAAHRLNLNFKCRTANNMLCVVIKCQLHKNNTPFAVKLHINRPTKCPWRGRRELREFITVRTDGGQASRPLTVRELKSGNVL